ncbi:MAG TPA: hypothetical protein DCP63_02815 [Bacteroidetes bacterium]|nr:hypothetical protein [Bacteroidota bacterium]
MKPLLKIDAETKKIALAVVLLTAVTFFAFYPSLYNGFTNWDDDKILLNSPLILDLSLSGIATMFTSVHYYHYHPLVTLTYAIEYHFWKFDAFVYHLTNLLLHIGNTLLVFWLVRSLRKGLLVPLVVALLFGVHPIHIESVVWVTERKDVLYAFFYLAGLVAYMAHQKKPSTKSYALVSSLFIFSLCSKAMAVTFPVLLFLFDFAAGRRFDKKSVLEKVPWLLLSVLIGILAISTQYPADGSHEKARISSDNLFFAAYGILFYLQKLILPTDLSCIYPLPGKVDGVLPAIFLVSPLLLAVFTSLAVLLRKEVRAIPFGGLFFLITVLPVLQLTPVGGVVAADRFIYVASIGFFYLVVEGGAWLYDRKLKAMKRSQLTLGLLCVLVITSYAALTWERTQVWRESLTLWNDVLSKHPQVAFAYNNRGNSLTALGEIDGAIEDYTNGLRYMPQHIDFYFNRGNAYRLKGEYERSLADYAIVIQARPQDPNAHHNRGMVYFEMQNYDRAVDDYTNAITLNSKTPLFYSDRGVAYAKLDEYDRALKDFEEAFRLSPEYAEAYYNRGLTYGRMGRLDQAITDFSKALSFLANDPDMYVERANAYYLKGVLDSAIRDWDKAVQLAPGNSAIYINRGIAFYKNGEYDKAVADFTEAARISPLSAEAYVNRAYAYAAKREFGLAWNDVDTVKSLGRSADPKLLGLLPKRGGRK